MLTIRTDLPEYIMTMSLGWWQSELTGLSTFWQCCWDNDNQNWPAWVHFDNVIRKLTIRTDLPEYILTLTIRTDQPEYILTLAVRTDLLENIMTLTIRTDLPEYILTLTIRTDLPEYILTLTVRTDLLEYITTLTIRTDLPEYTMTVSSGSWRSELTCLSTFDTDNQNWPAWVHYDNVIRMLTIRQSELTCLSTFW